MNAADAFPYPADDPESIRGLGASLSRSSTSLGTAVATVRVARATLQDRWASPAGGLAVAEVDAVGGLGDDAVTALADAQGPLDDYAAALGTARETIDVLRSQYDTAQTDYQAALDGIEASSLEGPLRREARSSALQDLDSRIADLNAQYDEAITVLKAAARGAGSALGVIAGRISPAPQSLNGDLVRASMLDQLPFMAAHDRTTVTRTAEHVLVDTSHGNDEVHVTRDDTTGAVTITVNGVAHHLSPEEAEDIVIRTNGGRDVIEVPPSIPLAFTLLAGGDDDRVVGGTGNDVLLGGDGNDSVVGDLGNDVIDGGNGLNHLQDERAVEAEGLPLLFGPIEVRRQDGGDDLIVGGANTDRINAGLGNDTIDAGDGEDVVYAGDGNDNVDAGTGRDYVDGYRGDDTIDAGDGEDVVYAGDGNDNVDAGTGRDYVDGYRGDDTLAGGYGKDTLSGGAGNDTLAGEEGEDFIYSGAGRDAVTDHRGTNTVYLQPEDAADVNPDTQRITVEIAVVPHNIHVDGSPQFEDRVYADLETLATSPTGQQMLERIHQQGDWLLGTLGDELTIIETDEGSSAVAPLDPDPRNDSTIKHNPRYREISGGSPIVVLYHEMAHSYDTMSGNVVGYDGGALWYVGPDTSEAPPGIDADGNGRISFDEVDRDNDGDIDDDDLDLDGDGVVDEDEGQARWVPNSERQAVGLPVDHDQNPATPHIYAHEVPGIDHPYALTENALRAEMGDPTRTSYRRSGFDDERR